MRFFLPNSSMHSYVDIIKFCIMSHETKPSVFILQACLCDSSHLSSRMQLPKTWNKHYFKYHYKKLSSEIKGSVIKGSSLELGKEIIPDCRKWPNVIFYYTSCIFHINFTKRVFRQEISPSEAEKQKVARYFYLLFCCQINKNWPPNNFDFPIRKHFTVIQNVWSREAIIARSSTCNKFL